MALTRLAGTPISPARWAARRRSSLSSQASRSAVVRTGGGLRRASTDGRLDAVPPVATNRSTSPSGACASTRSAALRTRARSSGLGGSDRNCEARTPDPTSSEADRIISLPRAITTSVEPPPRSTSAHSRREAWRLAAPRKLSSASRFGEMTRTGAPMTSAACRANARPSDARRTASVAQARIWS